MDICPKDSVHLALRVLVSYSYHGRMYKRAMRFANARLTPLNWGPRTKPVVRTAVTFEQRQRDRDLRMEIYLVSQIKHMGHLSSRHLKAHLKEVRQRMRAEDQAKREAKRIAYLVEKYDLDLK